MAAALLLALGCAHAGAPRPPLARAPVFEARTLQGEPVTIGGPGPVRVVELWATWCAPCVPASRVARAVLARHPRVQAFAVALDDDRGALAERLATSPPAGMPLVFAGGSAAARQRGLDELPAFIVLDARGRAVGRLVGLSPGLGPRLDRLLRNAEGAVGERG